jgi:hypothetical protein
MLAKLESIHPTPEQLGSGWTYATGRRRGVVGGKLINQVYANKTLGASSVRLEANRYESIDKAKKMYEMNISGIDTPPYSGIGQEARIENRKSRTKYVLLVFRRANIVIQVKGQGHDHGPVLRVAEVVDGMIKKNLE